MPLTITEFITKDLHRIKSKHLYRDTAAFTGNTSLILQADSKLKKQYKRNSFINFSSNDYLGFNDNQEIRQALIKGIQDYGHGSGASHLISGHNKIFNDFEKRIANWLGVESCLMFSTGYMANLGVITSLATKQDLILADRLVHASLIDACCLTLASFKRYRHNDIEHLQSQLRKYGKKYQKIFLVTDGVFSMEGDLCHLNKILNLAKKYNAIVILDDAHGFGVLGENGRGTCEYFKLQAGDFLENLIVIGTLGKAFGLQGAFVAGKRGLIKLLVNKARTYIYTTAISPSFAYANIIALKKIIDGKDLRQKLYENINLFCTQVQKIVLNKEVNLLESFTPIQSIVFGEPQRAIYCSSLLKQNGFWVQPIRYPTVAKNQERLRITLSAKHSFEHIIRLAITLKQVL